MKKKTQKRLVVSSFLVLLLIIPFAMFSLSSIPIPVFGTQIIRETKFENWNDKTIVNKEAENRKLVFTRGSWQIAKDDIEEVYTTVDEVSNQIYILYHIPIRNQIAIATNVLVGQSTPKWSLTSHSPTVVYWQRYGIWEDRIDWERKYAHFYWYETGFGGDFGAWKRWCLQNFLFTGDLTMTFFINDNLLPPLVDKVSGFEFEKTVDYISILDAEIESSRRGLLHDYDGVVKINVPDDTERATEERHDGYSDTKYSGQDADWSVSINAKIDIGKETWDEGWATSEGSISMTNLDGSATWSPDTVGKSMTGARIKVKIPRICPIIKIITGQFSWNRYDIGEHDNLFISNTFDPTSDSGSPRPIGIHTSNRFVYYNIKLNCLIWAKYKITSLDEGDVLVDPSDEFTDVVVNAVSGGVSSASSYTQAGIFDFLFGDPTAIITTILTLVFMIVGLVIFVKVVIPIIKLMKKAK